MPRRSPRDIPEMREKLWKKGQSGNPKGRPKRKTLEAWVLEQLDKEVGSGENRMTQMEMLARVIVQRLLRSDPAVTRSLLDRLWPAETNVNAKHSGHVQHDMQSLPPLTKKEAAAIKAAIEAERF